MLVSFSRHPRLFRMFYCPRTFTSRRSQTILPVSALVHPASIALMLTSGCVVAGMPMHHHCNAVTFVLTCAGLARRLARTGFLTSTMSVASSLWNDRLRAKPQPNDRLTRYLDALSWSFSPITKCGIRQRDPRRFAHFKMF